MPKRMLIEATHPEETRVVVADGNDLLEFDYETSTKRQIKSNIYLAKVTRVEPSLQAAFVDFGGNRHGFLAFNEIHPDYYRIPVEDREKLLAETEEEEEEDGAEGNGEDGEEVEVVGDGHDEDIHDLSDEHRRRLRKLTRTYKIQEVIKRRQILLVQVVKEERGNKGAALTTYLSLPGRYCVLMPNTSRGGGISRKITDAKHRKSMKAILSDLEVPEGMAVIMRTAGVGRTKAEIKRDFEYLRRLWDEIRETTLDSTAPALIYEEGDVIKRALRDIYDRDIDEVLVEGEEAYKSAKALMRTMIPSHAKRVQKYEDVGIPLFNRYQIDQQLDEIHEPIVQLKSGGYIVINTTEALVAIDVNSGRSTRERNVEQTAYRTNLEAADEVARQLRLRDLAGLVVIDFIDMDVSRNNHAVERRLKEAMKSDRARIQIGRISAFGLLELSRQRMRPSLLEAHSQLCPVCAGSGFVRSTESTTMSILRELEEEGLRKRASEVTVTARTDVALYLLNQKRDSLRDIEDRYGFKILVLADGELAPSEYEIEHTRAASGDGEESAVEEKSDEGGSRRRSRRGRRRPEEESARSADRSDSAEDAADEAEAGAEDEDGDDEDDEERGSRRGGRRRGRRGGRRRRRTTDGDETGVEASDVDETAESGDADEAVDATEEAERGAGSSDEDDEDRPRRRRRRPRRRGRRTRNGEDDVNGDEAVAVAAEAESADAVSEDDAAAEDNATASEPGIDAHDEPDDDEDEENAVDTDLDIPEPVSNAMERDDVADIDLPPETESADDAEDGHETADPVAAADDTVEAPDVTDEPEPEPRAEQEPEPEPVAEVPDDRPRRSGWWSRATSSAE